MVEAHQALSPTYKDLGGDEKSIGQLKEIPRIKHDNPNADHTTSFPAGSLLFTVRPPSLAALLSLPIFSENLIRRTAQSESMLPACSIGVIRPCLQGFVRMPSIGRRNWAMAAFSLLEGLPVLPGCSGRHNGAQPCYARKQG
jgi:hypothetical protein